MPSLGNQTIFQRNSAAVQIIVYILAKVWYTESNELPEGILFSVRYVPKHIE